MAPIKEDLTNYMYATFNIKTYLDKFVKIKYFIYNMYNLNFKLIYRERKNPA